MEKKKTISENDFITNKILIVFTLSLVGILALMTVYNLVLEAPTAIITIYSLQVLGALSIIGMIFGIYRYFAEKKRSIDVSRKLIKGTNIAVFFGILAFCSFFIISTNPASAIKTLYIIIPGFAVLYLIKMIFMREFFTISIFCSSGALLLWAASKLLSIGNSVFFAACIVIGIFCTILCAVILHICSKNNGIFKLGSFSRNIMDAKASYVAPFVTLALLALFFIAALFIKAQFIMFLSYAVLGYLFIMAVYFTVKLM